MTASNIPFTDIVKSLPAAVPFVGPETMERQRGERFRLRIGANESAFGACPGAHRAMVEALGHLSWYGDPENHRLRQALARRLGIEIDEVCVAAGIDALLGLAVRMLVRPGDTVVTSLGAYPTFNYHAAGFGGRLHMVPYRDDHEDLGGLLEAVIETGAPLVYLANPDNPMGSWHGAEAVQDFIDRLPDHTVLVLDEAYLEFAPNGTAPAIDSGDPRVIRMRTFSKAYGLAGARIGYALSHRDLVAGFNRIRNHFEVNRVAQAGALASLDDDSFVRDVARKVAAGRQAITAMAERLGLKALPSATNFVAVDLGSQARVRALLENLTGAGVFIRMPGVKPLNRCIRVGVSGPDDQALLEVLFEQELRRL